jgi:hypothetical protein
VILTLLIHATSTLGIFVTKPGRESVCETVHPTTLLAIATSAVVVFRAASTFTVRFAGAEACRIVVTLRMSARRVVVGASVVSTNDVAVSAAILVSVVPIVFGSGPVAFATAVLTA